MAARRQSPVSRLRRLAQSGPSTAQGTPPAGSTEERCELCGAPLEVEHRHLLNLDNRELMCACRACATLFDRDAAGGGHFRALGDRRLRLEGFALDDLAWERLRVPVEMAFFFNDSGAERVMAFYPSPMGPTESQLSFDTWDQIERANPIVGTLEPDVEALLVNRARGTRGHWLVPIDECYALVGLIRTRWRGFSGGSEVWEALDAFFTDLDRRSKPVEPASEQDSLATAVAGKETS